jgi:hypothetical protein
MCDNPPLIGRSIKRHVAPACVANEKQIRHPCALLSSVSHAALIFSSGGRKRRFLLYGTLNVLITNTFLQGMLIVFPTGAATMFSQLINMSLGYYLYGKGVFQVSRFTRRSAVGYILMALFLWWLNWFGIVFLAATGISKNLAALLLIPVLPLISYGIQKLFIFPA